MNIFCKQYFNIRKIIAEFFKIKYKESSIGGFNKLNIPRIISLDESLFSHDVKGQIWVVASYRYTFKKCKVRFNKRKTFK